MYPLHQASREFLNYCRFEKNLSSKTLKAYETDICQLQTFLTKKKHLLEVEKITKYQLREYLEEISSLKPKSIKRKIASIKSLFNYLEFEDRITISPLRKMRISIKEPKKLPRVLALDDVRIIFECAYENKRLSKSHEAIRDVAVLELLFATGARVSEIADLKTDNIDLGTGNILLRGKGNKERIIQVCNRETLHSLRLYYKTFRAKITTADNYFLINRDGRKLTDQSIRIIVNRIAKKAEIPMHVTPHVFRHSFGTLLLENDVDIKYIQLLLGHSSIMTTQIYTHVTREKQRHILKNKHPRRGFTTRGVKLGDS